MKRKHCAVVLTILMLLMLATFVFAGCDKPGDATPVNDDQYELTIEGLTPTPLVLTKLQIKTVYELKKVTYTSSSPVYASDKQDDDGNLIPHTLKGVYLDDVLEKYAGGVVSGAYSSMALFATDGYETILTVDTFSQEHGGSKMILALEYDNVVLNSNQKSGALRAVFPNQSANSWAKKLSKISFSNATLNPPKATKVTFVEGLEETKFNDSFEKQETISGETKNVSYYGLSLKKLFESGVLVSTQNDKMFMSAWDYVTDGQNGFTREYICFKSYEYFNDAFLVYKSQIEGSTLQNELHAPLFEGKNILKGMCVKNTLSMSVSSTALVSLKVAFDRFDSDENSKILLKDVLQLIKMNEENSSFKVVTSGGDGTFSFSEIQSVEIEKVNGQFMLNGHKILSVEKI